MEVGFHSIACISFHSERDYSWPDDVPTTYLPPSQTQIWLIKTSEYILKSLHDKGQIERWRRAWRLFPLPYINQPFTSKECSNHSCRVSTPIYIPTRVGIRSLPSNNAIMRCMPGLSRWERTPLWPTNALDQSHQPLSYIWNPMSPLPKCRLHVSKEKEEFMQGGSWTKKYTRGLKEYIRTFRCITCGSAG